MSSSLVDDTAVALTDEEEALAYWQDWTVEVWDANALWGSKANISAGAAEVFFPGFYQLNYLDEFASYTAYYLTIASEDYQSFAPLSDDEELQLTFYQPDYLDEFAAYATDYLASFPWDPTAGPLQNDLPQFVYVTSQAGYIALISQNLVVAGQAAYVTLISQDLVVASQTAYVVLLAKTTKNYSQAMMGTF